MKKIITPIMVLSFSILFAYALGTQSRLVLDVPLPWLLVPFSLLVQMIAFVPAVINNTEKHYDLTGSLTFISITLIATLTNPHIQLEQAIAALMVIAWAGRLGTFLFRRICHAKMDSRFVQIKKTKIRFLYAWLIQGLWVIITMSPLLALLTSKSIPESGELSFFELLGIGIWTIGMTIEIVADTQKSSFNSNPANKDKFICSGLWSYSRHPNYVGEIVLWAGAALFAARSLQGWQCIGLISPLFVYLLLKGVSGVPLLEKKADERWGCNKDYLHYKQSTPVLFPFPLASKIKQNND